MIAAFGKIYTRYLGEFKAEIDILKYASQILRNLLHDMYLGLQARQVVPVLGSAAAPTVIVIVLLHVSGTGL